LKLKTLVRDKDQVLFDGQVLDIYLPKKNFDRGISSYNGKFINTIGVFIFDIKTDTIAKKKGFGSFYTIKYPNPMQFSYSDQFTYKGTLDNGKVGSNEYNVFRLTKGDIFMNTTTVEQSSDAVIKFVNALHAGQIPESIPYRELIKLYLNAIDINHVNLKNPSVVFEMIISEICRDKSDLKKSFRESIRGKKDYNEFGYKSIDLKQLPSLNSTFAALSFQDFDRAVISGINMNNEGKKEKVSPIEKIIKY